MLLFSVLPAYPEIILAVLLRRQSCVLSEAGDKMAVRAEIEVISDIEGAVVGEFEHILGSLYPSGHDILRDRDPHLRLEQL